MFDIIGAEVYCYEINTNRWTTAPPMTRGRYGHSSVVIGNALYTCGGYLPNGKFLYYITRLLDADKKLGQTTEDCWQIIKLKGQN